MKKIVQTAGRNALNEFAPQFAHFENAKAHGVTQKEIAAVITHIAFYAGWPKGWAAFNLAMSAYIRKRMNALLNCQWMQSFYTHSF